MLDPQIGLIAGTLYYTTKILVIFFETTKFINANPASRRERTKAKTTNTVPHLYGTRSPQNQNLTTPNDKIYSLSHDSSKLYSCNLLTTTNYKYIAQTNHKKPTKITHNLSPPAA